MILGNMESFQTQDLLLIGAGANSQVYKVASKNAVVKTCRRTNDVLALYELVKKTGLPTVSFMGKCLLDGEDALLMEDLAADDMVWVSPNTIKQMYDLDGRSKMLCELSGQTYCPKQKSESESYLLENKIDTINNLSEVLEEISNISKISSQNGIELKFDTAFFGIRKNCSNPDVKIKIVDIDGIIIIEDDDQKESLSNYNKIELLDALEKFIEYFVSNPQVYLSQIRQYKRLTANSC